MITKYDVACSNYFKSLAAVCDYVLSKKDFKESYFPLTNLMIETNTATSIRRNKLRAR